MNKQEKTINEGQNETFKKKSKKLTSRYSGGSTYPGVLVVLVLELESPEQYPSSWAGTFLLALASKVRLAKWQASWMAADHRESMVVCVLF